MQKPNHIWIIDDDRSIRWVLERTLNQEGLQTTAFDTGDAALQALEAEAPDVVITDIRMPGIDGLSLLKALTDKIPGLPVIISSSIFCTFLNFSKACFKPYWNLFRCG